MKTAVIILTLCSLYSVNIFCQSNEPDSLLQKNYTAVDSFVLKIKKRYTNIEDLADTLTKNFEKTDEKIRAIYRWMTANIAYDYTDLKNDGYEVYKSNLKAEKNDMDFKYVYAQRVLQIRKGICMGYSYLFYELCKAAKIECTIVEGFASTNSRIISILKKLKYSGSNHAWNKVIIDNREYFIDVTWSSKNTDKQKSKKTSSYDPYYFLSPKEKGYYSHIPTSEH